MNATVVTDNARNAGQGTRARLRVIALRFHLAVALIGGLVLLAWGGSGLLHPLMVTFGPQQSVYYPPARALALQDIMPIERILANAGITTALAVKIVVAESDNLLQVTQGEFDARRYFSLTDGRELPDYDIRHAVFLARHYLGLSPEDSAVRAVDKLTGFTPDYPWVNRLLPVYRVSFDRDDNLAAYVDTQTNALAGVTNNFKETVQAGFRALHTWGWFPASGPWLRTAALAALVSVLFVMALSGVVMLITMRRRMSGNSARRWHRFAGWGLALPLLALSGSGVFHVLQYGVTERGKALQLSPPITLTGVEFPLHEQWQRMTAGLDVTTVSIVEDADGRHLYRLGLALPRGQTAPSGAAAIRNARFDGVARTGPALYVDARTGEPWPAGDEALALQLGERFTGAGPDAIVRHHLVTRFGPEYDFRNKRLPVWQLDYGAPINATVFVDTTSGVLADVTHDTDKPERWSFSMLHKWNFLLAFGRPTQNIVVVVIVLGAIIFMAGFGLRMNLVRRRR